MVVRETGFITDRLSAWENITTDRNVLDIVKGVRLDFSSIPCQASPPHPIRFKSDEEFLISQQLKQFLQRGIIRRARHEKGEFLSSIC